MAETDSGQLAGRYRVLGNLGKGAMGLVYMAYDPVLDRRVAIKQMTAEIADNEELRQRFYVEARAAARLNHPNIITIYELQESGGEIFMIMELLEGKSLAALAQVKSVPLSLEATLDVMSQVCDGLDYAHQKTIVHRDIKPANLFLTPSGTVKILDFGIARLGTLHMTATGALVGTPDYMAPEQIRGDEVDRRTDLWAVGAVLYQLLSGTKPFEGKPLSKLLSAISQSPHVPLQLRAPAVPKSVSDLVDRLLSKPRDGRPATAGVVRDELRAILGRESSAATKAMLAREGSDETVFIASPAMPPVPSTRPALETPVAPTAQAPPAPPPLPALQPAPAPPPVAASATAVPVSSTMRPSSGRMPVTEAAAAQAAVASSKASPTPAVAAKKPASRWLVMAVVGAVVAVFGLAALGGAGWWYFTQRSSGPGTGAAGGTLPPASAVTPAAPPATDAPAVVPQTTPPPATEPPAPPAAAEQQTPPASEPPPPATSQAAQRASQPPAAVTAPQAKVPAAGTPPKPAVTSQAQQPGAPSVVTEPPKAAGKPPAAPVETGVVPSATARPGVNRDTVDLLTGKQAGEAYDTGSAASTQAAVARINYVLEQYVKALVNADAEAIKEFRPSLSPAESALMRARQLKVRLEGVRIEVNGSEATARCRRRIEGTSDTGAPLQEDSAAVFRLVRKPTGWVIADVR